MSSCVVTCYVVDFFVTFAFAGHCLLSHATSADVQLLQLYFFLPTRNRSFWILSRDCNALVSLSVGPFFFFDLL